MSSRLTITSSEVVIFKPKKQGSGDAAYELGYQVTNGICLCRGPLSVSIFCPCVST